LGLNIPLWRRRKPDNSRHGHDVLSAAVQVASFTSYLLSYLVVSRLDSLAALFHAPQPAVRHRQTEDNES
jgi:hypothetical protein